MIRKCGECFYFNRGKPLEPGQHMAVCEAFESLRADRIYRRDDEAACIAATKTTLDRTQWDLMRAPTVKKPYCVVCGFTGHLEQHHLVRRGDGNICGPSGTHNKPTVTLCGNGNTSGCHGLAHSHRLNFRYTDRLEYLITEDPTDRLTALSMEGWKAI